MLKPLSQRATLEFGILYDPPYTTILAHCIRLVRSLRYLQGSLISASLQLSSSHVIVSPQTFLQQRLELVVRRSELARQGGVGDATLALVEGVQGSSVQLDGELGLAAPIPPVTTGSATDTGR